MMSATTISLTYNNRELHTKMNICSTYVESDLKNIRPALSKYIAKHLHEKNLAILIFQCLGVVQHHIAVTYIHCRAI